MLQGTHVIVLDNRFRYEALAELSPGGTRWWGEPDDIQDLAQRLQNYFSLGITILDHRLNVAFHFRPNERVGLL